MDPSNCIHGVPYLPVSYLFFRGAPVGTPFWRGAAFSVPWILRAGPIKQAHIINFPVSTPRPTTLTSGGALPPLGDVRRFQVPPTALVRKGWRFSNRALLWSRCAGCLGHSRESCEVSCLVRASNNWSALEASAGVHTPHAFFLLLTCDGVRGTEAVDGRLVELSLRCLGRERTGMLQ